MRYGVFFAIVLGLSFTAAWAEEPEVDQEVVDSVAAVQFHGEDIFEVTNISTLSAEGRAELLAKRLKKLAKSPLINTNSFTLHHDDDLKISDRRLGHGLGRGVFRK